jgi:hypothetical protein
LSSIATASSVALNGAATDHAGCRQTKATSQIISKRFQWGNKQTKISFLNDAEGLMKLNLGDLSQLIYYLWSG